MVVAKMKPATCHPDKPRHARGLCRRCYTQHYSKNGPRATCHPKMLRYTKDGLCVTCYQKRLAKQNPKWSRDRKINKHRFSLQAKYGITVEHYEDLLKKQGNVCAICKTEKTANKSKSKLSVDHDHESGQVRGLLCDRCNRGIGLLGDSPEILAAAAEYLRHWREFVSPNNTGEVGLGCE